MKRICFVGASTTEGMGDETGQGWPGRLTSTARDRIVGYNLGVRGQLLAEINARARSECAARLLHPSLGGIVFCSGMNDIARHNGIPRTPKRRVLETFEAILSALQEVAPVISVGPLPVYAPKMPYHSVVTGLDLDFRNDDIQEMDAAYGGICRDLGIAYLPVFEDLLKSDIYGRSLEQGDGLHPGGEGYQLVADKIAVWQAWQQLIQDAN